MFTLNNNRNSKFQIVFTAVITVIAILTLGMAKFSAASVADHSYDAVEQIHAIRPLAPASSFASYDKVENVRVERALSPVASSYDRLEQLRNTRGLIADRSYDQIETLRAAARTSFAVDISYNSIEQLRTNRGLVADRSYDLIETVRLQP
jgi:hypothetical protein